MAEVSPSTNRQFVSSSGMNGKSPLASMNSRNLNQKCTFSSSSCRSALSGARSVSTSSTSWLSRFWAGTVASSAAAVTVDDEAEELNQGIASFYDASSRLWEDVWGEHMHHGFYEPDKPLGDHKAAQVLMIEQALNWAGISENGEGRPQSIVDVGCGIGGSARHLAKKYSANVNGITLSPVQAQRARSITAAAGLSDEVSFQVADALKQPFADNQFDLVWSMESGEHMPNKQKFMQELVRVAAPGGRLLIVTWCHRDLSPDELSLTTSEQDLLNKICNAYYLPAWCSTSDYVKLAESLQLEDIRAADWSEYVSPFWPAVIASAFNLKALLGLLKSGWATIRGAFAMAYMVQGYKNGLIKFAIITARKPLATP